MSSCLRTGTRTRNAGASLLGLLTLAAALLSACGGDDPVTPDQPADDPLPVPVAIPPATSVPGGLDDALTLPEDVDPVVFDYTEVSFETPGGGSGRLGMLVADTIERRTRGLMHRTALPRDTGMLFAFPVETRSPFWNRDTPMDLEIAFLDLGGVIHGILPLAANDLALLRPEIPYLYAVEMPAGWWAANGVAVGARFRIPSGVVGLAE